MSRFRISPMMIIAAVIAILVLGFFVMSGTSGSDSAAPAPAIESTDAPSVTELADLETAEEFVANTGIEERLDTSELDATLGGN